VSVRIRLTRMGRKNRPYYRIGAYDNRTRRDGRAIEFLGTYDPLNPDAEKQYSMDNARMEYWVSVGATPSETVASLMRKSGVKMPEKKAKKA
jgi:small subunit ribosomal protein S16